MIVDAQVHVRAADVAPGAAHTYPGRYAAIGPELLLKEMDRAGVSRTILVPPITDRPDLTVSAAQSHPDRFAVFGAVDMAAEDPAARVKSLLELPHVKGIRAAVRTKDVAIALSSPRAERLWAILEADDVPLMLWAPDAYPAVRALSERHPELRIGIDHFGLGLDVRDGEITDRVQQLVELAEVPTISVKATALPSYVSSGYPFETLHDPIRSVIDSFGPARVFWGSDLSRLHCTYGEVVTLFTEALGLSEGERRTVMGSALLAWAGWTDD